MQKKINLPGRLIAAPSWVTPGSLADNCFFLADKVDEVGLLFFEEKACLAYTEKDLPKSLKALPLRYHVHLPTDITRHPPQKAAAICHALMQKIAFLGANKAVLHPPPPVTAPDYLPLFCSAWKDYGYKSENILLENTQENNLNEISSLIAALGIQVCLDLGHLLAYEQFAIVTNETLLERTSLLHLNAPGQGEQKSRHLPLTTLSPEASLLGKQLCQRTPKNCTLMLELFDYNDIVLSLPVLTKWLEQE